MTWEAYGVPYYDTTDLEDTSASQPMKFDENALLKAVRIWVIFFNNPTLTSLNMKIYANDEQAAVKTPTKLLYTSTNTVAKADICTLNHGLKEIYFEFDDVNIRKDTWYHFVLNSSGYSGSQSSHIAWRNSYPDPQYTEGVTLDKANLAKYPLSIYPIFARFSKT